MPPVKGGGGRHCRSLASHVASAIKEATFCTSSCYMLLPFFQVFMKMQTCSSPGSPGGL